MMRSDMHKQVSTGLNADKQRREKSANDVPKVNIAGSGSAPSGNKNTMGNGDGCCAKSKNTM